MVTPTDVAAYSVPIAFLLTIGYVLLVEMLAEPYGLYVAGAQVDNGSRVISMLLPTLISGLLKALGMVAVLVAAIILFTANGRAAFQRIVAGGGRGSKRFD